ncbi:MAG: carboxymuconolactone decarboxylase family protein [Pseudomonadota bacterium]
MTDTLLHRTPRDELPEPLRQVWDRLNELTGEPTFVEVFASAPELLDFVMGQFYGNIFFGGRVAERYKQIARLKLSLVHGCRTCNLQNVPGAREAGISQAQIDALDDADDPVHAPPDRAVIRFAEQMVLTNPDGRMDSELYGELSAHFSDAEICELGTVMAVIGGMAKLSFVIDVVEKETYCPFAAAS